MAADTHLKLHVVLDGSRQFMVVIGSNKTVSDLIEEILKVARYIYPEYGNVTSITSLQNKEHYELAGLYVVESVLDTHETVFATSGLCKAKSSRKTKRVIVEDDVEDNIVYNDDDDDDDDDDHDDKKSSSVEEEKTIPSERNTAQISRSHGNDDADNTSLRPNLESVTHEEEGTILNMVTPCNMAQKRTDISMSVDDYDKQHPNNEKGKLKTNEPGNQNDTKRPKKKTNLKFVLRKFVLKENESIPTVNPAVNPCGGINRKTQHIRSSKVNQGTLTVKAQKDDKGIRFGVEEKILKRAVKKHRQSVLGCIRTSPGAPDDLCSTISEAVLSSEQFKSMLESSACSHSKNRKRLKKSVTKVASWLASSHEDYVSDPENRGPLELFDSPSVASTKSMTAEDSQSLGAIDTGTKHRSDCSDDQEGMVRDHSALLGCQKTTESQYKETLSRPSTPVKIGLDKCDFMQQDNISIDEIATAINRNEPADLQNRIDSVGGEEVTDLNASRCVLLQEKLVTNDHGVQTLVRTTSQEKDPGCIQQENLVKTASHEQDTRCVQQENLIIANRGIQTLVKTASQEKDPGCFEQENLVIANRGTQTPFRIKSQKQIPQQKKVYKEPEVQTPVRTTSQGRRAKRQDRDSVCSVTESEVDNLAFPACSPVRFIRSGSVFYHKGSNKRFNHIARATLLNGVVRMTRSDVSGYKKWEGNQSEQIKYRRVARAVKKIGVDDDVISFSNSTTPDKVTSNKVDKQHKSSQAPLDSSSSSSCSTSSTTPKKSVSKHGKLSEPSDGMSSSSRSTCSSSADLEKAISNKENDKQYKSSGRHEGGATKDATQHPSFSTNEDCVTHTESGYTIEEKDFASRDEEIAAGQGTPSETTRGINHPASKDKEPPADAAPALTAIHPPSSLLSPTFSPSLSASTLLSHSAAVEDDDSKESTERNSDKSPGLHCWVRKSRLPKGRRKSKRIQCGRLRSVCTPSVWENHCLSEDQSVISDSEMDTGEAPNATNFPCLQNSTESSHIREEVSYKNKGTYNARSPPRNVTTPPTPDDSLEGKKSPCAGVENTGTQTGKETAKEICSKKKHLALEKNSYTALSEKIISQCEGTEPSIGKGNRHVPTELMSADMNINEISKKKNTNEGLISEETVAKDVEKEVDTPAYESRDVHASSGDFTSAETEVEIEPSKEMNKNKNKGLKGDQTAAKDAEKEVDLSVYESQDMLTSSGDFTSAEIGVDIEPSKKRKKKKEGLMDDQTVARDAGKEVDTPVYESRDELTSSNDFTSAEIGSRDELTSSNDFTSAEIGIDIEPSKKRKKKKKGLKDDQTVARDVGKEVDTPLYEPLDVLTSSRDFTSAEIGLNIEPSKKRKKKKEGLKDEQTVARDAGKEVDTPVYESRDVVTSSRDFTSAEIGLDIEPSKKRKKKKEGLKDDQTVARDAGKEVDTPVYESQDVLTSSIDFTSAETGVEIEPSKKRKKKNKGLKDDQTVAKIVGKEVDTPVYESRDVHASSGDFTSAETEVEIEPSKEMNKNKNKGLKGDQTAAKDAEKEVDTPVYESQDMLTSSGDFTSAEIGVEIEPSKKRKMKKEGLMDAQTVARDAGKEVDTPVYESRDELTSSRDFTSAEIGVDIEPSKKRKKKKEGLKDEQTVAKDVGKEVDKPLYEPLDVLTSSRDFTSAEIGLDIEPSKKRKKKKEGLKDDQTVARDAGKEVDTTVHESRDVLTSSIDFTSAETGVEIEPSKKRKKKNKGLKDDQTVAKIVEKEVDTPVYESRDVLTSSRNFTSAETGVGLKKFKKKKDEELISSQTVIGKKVNTPTSESTKSQVVPASSDLSAPQDNTGMESKKRTKKSKKNKIAISVGEKTDTEDDGKAVKTPVPRSAALKDNPVAAQNTEEAKLREGIIGENLLSVSKEEPRKQKNRENYLSHVQATRDMSMDDEIPNKGRLRVNSDSVSSQCGKHKQNVQKNANDSSHLLIKENTYIQSVASQLEESGKIRVKPKKRVKTRVLFHTEEDIPAQRKSGDFQCTESEKKQRKSKKEKRGVEHSDHKESEDSCEIDRKKLNSPNENVQDPTLVRDVQGKKQYNLSKDSYPVPVAADSERKSKKKKSHKGKSSSLQKDTNIMDGDGADNPNSGTLEGEPSIRREQSKKKENIAGTDKQKVDKERTHQAKKSNEDVTKVADGKDARLNMKFSDVLENKKDSYESKDNPKQRRDPSRSNMKLNGKGDESPGKTVTPKLPVNQQQPRNLIHKKKSKKKKKRKDKELQEAKIVLSESGMKTADKDSLLSETQVTSKTQQANSSTHISPKPSINTGETSETGRDGAGKKCDSQVRYDEDLNETGRKKYKQKRSKMIDIDFTNSEKEKVLTQLSESRKRKLSKQDHIGTCRMKRKKTDDTDSRKQQDLSAKSSKEPKSSKNSNDRMAADAQSQNSSKKRKHQKKHHVLQGEKSDTEVEQLGLLEPKVAKSSSDSVYPAKDDDADTGPCHTKASTLASLVEDLPGVPKTPKSSFYKRSSSDPTHRPLYRHFHATPTGFTNTLSRTPRKLSHVTKHELSARRPRLVATTTIGGLNTSELKDSERDILSGGISQLDKLLADDSFWEP
ncbi:uncharacterized protein LOC116601433 isoform X2 [Nematostella vectensis]|uniref:uncharacterized protein LOC116601433 isoform X2 n=1 Tax=Nematostella vectensis TaxID=45351 RepID=UPI00207789AF|nr:uncharacterized protein LOC116601433 isoform X2 [Nematostella vectensis]